MTSDRPRIAESFQSLRNAQKPAKGAPLYSRLVNRPLGRLLAAVAYHYGLTPNIVSLISAVFTYAAIALLFTLPPTAPVAITVPLFLVLGYALDAADGQLARLRGGGTLSGEWIDHVVDSGKIATLHLGVVVMVYRWFDVASIWLAVPLVFTAVSVVHFFGMLLTELLTRVHRATHPLPAPADLESTSILVAALKLPTDYGLLCLVFATAPFPLVFGVLYSLLAAGTTAYTLMALPVWYRRIRALDREEPESQ